MSWRVLRAADHVSVPWKNGGGTTVEIASSGGEPFTWRASLARVASDGPFSDFTGYDRVLVLLEGPGFTLHFPDGDHIVDRPLVLFPFDGATPCTATLRGGPSLDWNWMVSRTHHKGTLVLVKKAGLVSGRVIFALAPAELKLSGKAVSLGRHDAVVAPDRILGTFVSGGPLLVGDVQDRT